MLLIKYGLFDFVGEWRPESPQKVQKMKDMTIIVLSGPFNSKPTN